MNEKSARKLQKIQIKKSKLIYQENRIKEQNIEPTEHIIEKMKREYRKLTEELKTEHIKIIAGIKTEHTRTTKEVTENLNTQSKGTISRIKAKHTRILYEKEQELEEQKKLNYYSLPEKYSKFIGVTFGRLTIQSFLPKKTEEGRMTAVCLCSCGNKKEVLLSSLKIGHTLSCGCNKGKNRIHLSQLSEDYQYVYYDISKIKETFSSRKINPLFVNQLKESILKLGWQNSWVSITKAGVLWDGNHRLEAVKQLGWTEIPAIIETPENLRIAQHDRNFCNGITAATYKKRPK